MTRIMKILLKKKMNGLFIQLSQVNIGNNIISKIPDEMPYYALKIHSL